MVREYEKSKEAEENESRSDGDQEEEPRESESDPIVYRGQRRTGGYLLPFGDGRPAFRIPPNVKRLLVL